MALDYLLGPQSEISVVTVREEFNSYLAEMELSGKPHPACGGKIIVEGFLLAMDFLHIPATSTPSERVFSTTGNTVTQKRNCLKPYS